jgi:hypothetical protein
MQHGKRADAIVKGMLQHSRNSTGNKELTDVNALCAEYIKLSYQGIRARDPLFFISSECYRFFKSTDRFLIVSIHDHGCLKPDI